MVDIPYDFFNTTQPVDPITGAHGTYFVHGAIHYVTWAFYRSCLSKRSGWEVLGWLGFSPLVIMDFNMQFNHATRKFYLKTWEVNRDGRPVPGHWIVKINATFIEGRRAEGYPFDLLAYDVACPVVDTVQKFLPNYNYYQTKVCGCGYATNPPWEHIFNPDIGDKVEYNYDILPLVPKFKYFFPNRYQHVTYLLTYNDLPSWYLILPTTTEQRFAPVISSVRGSPRTAGKIKLENLPEITRRQIMELDRN
jgi:hypothetical protein